MLLINLLFSQRAAIDNYITVIYSYFLFFPVTITCSLYILCFCKKHNIYLNALIKLFILAAFLQALLALMALISRDFKEILLSVMYNHTNNNLLLGEWLNHRRFFGFSRNMLDQFGLGTGIICGIVILQTRKFRKYILFIPFFVLLTFLNAKTGLIIIIFSIALFIYDKSNRTLVLNFTKRYIFLLMISLIFFIIFIYIFSPQTIEWVLNDFLSFLPNENHEGISSLLFSKSFWTLPDNIFDIIFGTGHNVFATAGFAHSDVGYINEIWKTGLFGFAILYGSIFRLLKSLVTSKIYIVRNIGVLFLVSIILFMVKGQIIGYNPATPLIFTLSLFTYSNDKDRVI